MGLFDKLFKRNKEQQEQKEALDEGLKKTKDGFFSKLTKAIAGKDTVDEEVLDQVEEALVGADVGIDTTVDIIKNIEARAAKDKYVGTSQLNQILQEEIMAILTKSPSNEFETFDIPAGKKPYVILVVGVNGVGKTTTIGKLAHNFKKNGKSVLLGAADTFRAAAVDQLTIWSDRVGVPIVKKDMGSDPSSVAFDAVETAVARGSDVVLTVVKGRVLQRNRVLTGMDVGAVRAAMDEIGSRLAEAR